MSREAFERIHCGGNKHIARRNEHGDYVLPAIQDAWAGWQAATAAALEEAAEVADAHATCEGIGQRIAVEIRALKEPQ